MDHWTKQLVIETAARYKTRMAFIAENRAMYSAAHKHGWLAEAFAHMPKNARHEGGAYKWTDDEIRKTVAKYEDFKSFRENESSLFVILSQTRRVNEFTGHLVRTRNKNGYWTKWRCAEAAEQCVTRSDFSKRFPAAADAAYRYGWVDDICRHMEVANAAMSRVVYTIKKVGKNEIYVGLSGNPKRRYRGHLTKPMPHILSLVSGPHRFRVIGSYRPVREAASLEKRMIAHFQRKGWNVVNVTEGGHVGVSPRKWTRKELERVAKECGTRGVMFRRHIGAYDAAHRRGLMDAIFAGLPNRGYGDGPIRDWTLERMQEIADQCASIADMKKRFPKAAQAAYRRGVLPDLFAGRPNGGYSVRGPVWTWESVLEAARECSSVSELRNKNYRAFRAAERRGWLTDLFGDRR